MRTLELLVLVQRNTKNAAIANDFTFSFEVFTVINSMITLIKSQVQKNTSDVYCFLVL